MTPGQNIIDSPFTSTLQEGNKSLKVILIIGNCLFKIIHIVIQSSDCILMNLGNWMQILLFQHNSSSACHCTL